MLIDAIFIKNVQHFLLNFNIRFRFDNILEENHDYFIKNIINNARLISKVQIYIKL